MSRFPVSRSRGRGPDTFVARFRRRMGCRSFWDTETDNYAEYTFQSDTLICVASAFGVYYY